MVVRLSSRPALVLILLGLASLTVGSFLHARTSPRRAPDEPIVVRLLNRVIEPKPSVFVSSSTPMPFFEHVDANGKSLHWECPWGLHGPAVDPASIAFVIPHQRRVGLWFKSVQWNSWDAWKNESGRQFVVRSGSEPALDAAVRAHPLIETSRFSVRPRGWILADLAGVSLLALTPVSVVGNIRRARRRRGDLVCGRCDYDLSGLGLSTCPECG